VLFPAFVRCFLRRQSKHEARDRLDEDQLLPFTRRRRRRKEEKKIMQSPKMHFFFFLLDLQLIEFPVKSAHFVSSSLPNSSTFSEGNDLKCKQTRVWRAAFPPFFCPFFFPPRRKSSEQKCLDRNLALWEVLLLHFPTTPKGVFSERGKYLNKRLASHHQMQFQPSIRLISPPFLLQVSLFLPVKRRFDCTRAGCATVKTSFLFWPENFSVETHFSVGEEGNCLQRTKTFYI